MKKVLMIMDDGKRLFTHARVSGMLEQMKKSSRDICLYAFRSGGAYRLDSNYNTGEYNIYRLPDLQEFDGIILDINSIHNKASNWYGARSGEEIIRAARNSGKPVISIANRVEGFYYVGIDNYAAMQSMVSYLYETHHPKSFWLIMGPEDNYENKLRTRAITDYLREKGIPCGADQIYFETYESLGGIHGFHKLLEKHGAPPEAVICANDNLAIGVCRAAKERGYQVPDDFLVSGFDNFNLSSFYSPRISTVDQMRFSVGGKCIEVLEKIWDGESVPIENHTPTMLIPRESTRCFTSSDEDLEQRIVHDIVTGIDQDAFNEELLSIEYRLPDSASVREICSSFVSCFPLLRCSAFYVVLDPKLKDYRNQVTYDFGENHLTITQSGLLTKGYADTMDIVFAWKDGEIFSPEDPSIHGLFPAFEPENAGDDYFFIPLHFREYTAGYLMIRSGCHALEMKFIAPLANALSTALYNYFYGKKIEYLNRILSGMSITDALTEFYNRMGLQTLGGQMYENARAAQQSLAVIFIDMDQMKYLNDTYGHSCGDDALLTIAGSIRDNCPDGALAARMGGDEFLLLLPAQKEPEMIPAMIQRIQETLPVKASEYHMPIVPSISVGFVLTDPASPLSLNDYVDQADRLMYRDKTAKRAQK